MSTINSIKLTGLASGIDTDAMIESMLTAEQNKIDKAQQKEQTITWQQEIYREIISAASSLNEKYFSLTSKNSIISSSAWNTLSISSSNSSMMSAKGQAGASEVNYEFKVTKLAQPAKVEQSFSSKTDLVGAGKLDITVGNGKAETIELDDKDTVESMIKKINDKLGDTAKASYSEMTGKFTIKTTETGSSATIKVSKDGTEIPSTNGTNMEGKVYDADGNEVKDLKDQSSNSFTIDNIQYDIYTTGTSNVTSKQDYQTVLDNVNAFIDEYNSLMDKIYSLVTEKTNSDYPPLTEAQKDDMSEDEIEKWEKKAKQGVLRNDSELRRFMDNMQTAIFGDSENMKLLNSMGLSSHENYNKKGQISLDEDKFIKALENDSSKVYQVFAGDSKSVFENMKSVMKTYVGGSSSIFAKKAGLESTASFTNNYYSTQLKKQAELIKTLQTKFSDKETALYKKFANLESSMNTLNNQMSYFSTS